MPAKPALALAMVLNLCLVDGNVPPDAAQPQGPEDLFGSIKLVNNTWDYVAVVEIRWGNNAPQRPQGRRTVRGMSRDFELVREGRICFRRSGNPSDASSNLTNWRCSSNPSSRPETFSIY